MSVSYEGSSKNGDPIRLTFRKPISLTDIISAESNCAIEYMIGEDTEGGMRMLQFGEPCHTKNPDGSNRKFKYIEAGYYPFEKLPTTEPIRAMLKIKGEE